MMTSSSPVTLSRMTLLLSLIPLLSLSHYASADMNGMDMSMDGAMDLVMGMMKPYIHFTSGDMLWFMGWTPVSKGAMAGTCIGLFLLAIVERWIAACRSLMEIQLSAGARRIVHEKASGPQKHPLSTRTSSSKDEKQADLEASVSEVYPTIPNAHTSTKTVMQILRTVPPFIPSHDIPRGVVHAGQALLGYAFMLAVMTYQGSFILAICIGLGVGETLFGRYMAHARL